MLTMRYIYNILMNRLYENYVIHLAHGRLFGTRRIWFNEELLVDVSKLLDSGSSHYFPIGTREGRIIIR